MGDGYGAVIQQHVLIVAIRILSFKSNILITDFLLPWTRRLRSLTARRHSYVEQGGSSSVRYKWTVLMTHDHPVKPQVGLKSDLGKLPYSEQLT